MIKYKDLDRLIQEAKAYLKEAEETNQKASTTNSKPLGKKIGNVSLKTVRLGGDVSKAVTKL